MEIKNPKVTGKNSVILTPLNLKRSGLLTS